MILGQESWPRSRVVTQSLNLYFVRNSGGEGFVNIDWTEHHRAAFAFNGLPLQTIAIRDHRNIKMGDHTQLHFALKGARDASHPLMLGN